MKYILGMIAGCIVLCAIAKADERESHDDR